jgi:hypothetical protein
LARRTESGLIFGQTSPSRRLKTVNFAARPFFPKPVRQCGRFAVCLGFDVFFARRNAQGKRFFVCGNRD